MPVRVLDSLMESYGIKGIDGTRASHGAELNRPVIVRYPYCSKRIHIIGNSTTLSPVAS